MFTYLRDAWRQEKFDTLGDMRWSTPAEGTVSLHPAFSMSVDKSFADIQMFDFNGTAELRAWLSALSAQATAKADGCDALLRRRQARRHPRDLLGQLRGRPREDPHGIRRLIFSDKHVTPWKRGTKEGIITGIKKVRKR